MARGLKEVRARTAFDGAETMHLEYQRLVLGPSTASAFVCRERVCVGVVSEKSCVTWFLSVVSLQPSVVNDQPYWLLCMHQRSCYR